MPYTEPELIKTLSHMIRVYSESYPEDQESVERFLTWVLSQWGYR
jgi:hypothetical protein